MVTIREVMNGQVAVVSPDATVRETIELLTTKHIGAAPVIDGGGELVGMISELALLDVVFDEPVRDEPVSKFMNTDLHVVHPDEPLSRAAQLFALYAFRRLPV